MQVTLQLTQEELSLIESAIEMAITTLRNRFEEEAGFVHPAKYYELLYDKITEWSELLPLSNFSITNNPVSICKP